MKILAHVPFIGDTGYNNHARSFFTALNKYCTVRVRNYTVGKTWNGYSQNCHDSEPYMTSEMKEMLILQTLHDANGKLSDYPLNNYKGDFVPDVNIILNDVNHPYFDEPLTGYTIGYNVWETTKYPDDFFHKILKYDEFWVPSQWQKDNLIKQGYPSHKVFVVPEGVDGDVFKPAEEKKEKSEFIFLLFGRWEYRKSTKEIIETFCKTFSENEPVKLIASVDNPFAQQGHRTAEEQLSFFNISHKNIQVVHFPNRLEYINYLQQGDVFLSCARSEGWNLPLIEAMACGTPSVYSNWGAQLEFAQGKGIPVSVTHEVPASNQNPYFTGNYIEPDYQDLALKMREAYNNYSTYKEKAILDSKELREKFSWDNAAFSAVMILERKKQHKLYPEDFAFVTCGNAGYMNIIEKMAKSLSEFSNAKLIVYGVDCGVPFDLPNVIKRRISSENYSEHDKWYWKQQACLESLNENFKNFVWIDGDVVVNYNIDNIKTYFSKIQNYPLSDIHVPEEFYGSYVSEGQTRNQHFNQNLCELMGVAKSWPYMHVCLFIYNKDCDWWFRETIQIYKSIDLKDYSKYLLWNDEGIDNALRWKYGFKDHLPLSNFDTSSYDGDAGQTQNHLKDFYDFWNKEGPNNFNRVYGWQYIPKDKSQILYFHGNKNTQVSDEMIRFIKMKRDNSFFKSESFFTAPNQLKHLGNIKHIAGGTWDVAMKYGWDYAIYHEIFNLQDYYLERKKAIHDGDVVVDLGANLGIFNRWAYSQGASRVISFEPDKRYFKLLKLNADPRSILFNAAVSNKMGEMALHESNHLGGSTLICDKFASHYKVKTYTLDYLFESKLINKIDFLKVDIEGAEQMAFQGISDGNLCKVKTIAMEYHHEALKFDEELRSNLIKRLNRLGFNSYLLLLGSDNKLQYIYFYR